MSRLRETGTPSKGKKRQKSETMHKRQHSDTSHILDNFLLKSHTYRSRNPFFTLLQAVHVSTWLHYHTHFSFSEDNLVLKMGELLFQGTICLESGSYLLNFASCKECGRREPLKILDKVDEEDEDGEEMVTYKRM